MPVNLSSTIENLTKEIELIYTNFKQLEAEFFIVRNKNDRRPHKSAQTERQSCINT